MKFVLSSLTKKDLEKGKLILKELLKNSFYKKLYVEWKRHYQSVNDPAHDWQHVDFVLRLALFVAKKEKVDLDVVFVSALLHDCARDDELKGKCKSHERGGAEKAKEILKNLDLNSKQKFNIIHSIKEHSSSKGKPKTIEAKILADCDKFYAIITNPQRCIEFGKLKGRSMENSYNYLINKLDRLKPVKFYTKFVKEVVKVEYPLLKERVSEFEEFWNSL